MQSAVVPLARKSEEYPVPPFHHRQQSDAREHVEQVPVLSRQAAQELAKEWHSQLPLWARQPQRVAAEVMQASASDRHAEPGSPRPHPRRHWGVTELVQEVRELSWDEAGELAKEWFPQLPKWARQPQRVAAEIKMQASASETHAQPSRQQLGQTSTKRKVAQKEKPAWNSNF